MIRVSCGELVHLEAVLVVWGHVLSVRTEALVKHVLHRTVNCGHLLECSHHKLIFEDLEELDASILEGIPFNGCTLCHCS